MAQFKGQIYRIDETRQVTEKFQAREFIVQEVFNTRFGEQVNPVKFQVTQQYCSLLDNYSIGDEVVIQYNLDGRLWENDKGEEICFINANAYRIDKTSDVSQKEPDDEPQNDDFEPPTEPEEPSKEDDHNNLPF